MSNALEFTGTVTQMDETQIFDSGFAKKQIRILEDADKYPQTIPFEFIKERIDQLNEKGVTVGAKVKVKYNLRGNEWKDRIFVSLQAWYVELLQPAPSTSQDIEEDVRIPPTVANVDDELGDVPF